MVEPGPHRTGPQRPESGDPASPLPLLASLGGMAAGLALTRALPVVPSTLVNALMLATGARLSASCHQSSRWWLLIGSATGTLIGNGWVLALTLQGARPREHLAARLAAVVLLVLAGAIAGRSLSRANRAAVNRRPSDLLRAASGLTAGLFAALVTFTFIHSGLDAARAFSSRLSTSLTILVICLAAPGWFSHLLHQAQVGAGHDPNHAPTR